MHIDCDFPGGNILVDRVDGDTVHLHQDRRTTTEWWFYWCFRVRGAAGRTVRFTFTDGDVFTHRGPCFSRDAGRTWSWLGRDVVVDNGFTHAFGPDDQEARFALSFPYTRRDLDAFLAPRPQIARGVLCASEAGREVPLLTCASRTGRHVVPITCRMHACEAMASFVLEGLLDFWSADASTEAAFLREHVTLHAVPFMDVDGVEQGDQGKLRSPWDHNRDWGEQHIWSATRALIAKLDDWSDRIALAFDLHCPWIRGAQNDELFFVGPPPPWDARVTQFAHTLERTHRGPLRYRADTTFPSGKDWNQPTGRSFSSYVPHRFPWCNFAVAVEVPYAVAGGQTMTPAGARGFGHDLARAIAVHVPATRP